MYGGRVCVACGFMCGIVRVGVLWCGDYRRGTRRMRAGPEARAHSRVARGVSGFCRIVRAPQNGNKAGRFCAFMVGFQRQPLQFSQPANAHPAIHHKARLRQMPAHLVFAGDPGKGDPFSCVRHTKRHHIRKRCLFRGRQAVLLMVRFPSSPACE